MLSQTRSINRQEQFWGIGGKVRGSVFMCSAVEFMLLLHPICILEARDDDGSPYAKAHQPLPRPTLAVP